MKRMLAAMIIVVLWLPMFSMLVKVRADSSTSTSDAPILTPAIYEVNGTLLPMPDESWQNHWWDEEFWATSSADLPPQMSGSFVAADNVIGNLESGAILFPPHLWADSVLYLPLNVVYGTDRYHCVWFQFDIQFNPPGLLWEPKYEWYIWDINGPGTNESMYPNGDYHSTSIGIPYTPGHEYSFSLTTSGTDTVTFNIVDETTKTPWSWSNWVWTVPSLTMLYDTSMFSPASAIEGRTTNNQSTDVPLTNVPYFQTSVGNGINSEWHRSLLPTPAQVPSGIGSDVGSSSPGYYYWYMYDNSPNAHTIIRGLNWLRNTQGTDGSWNLNGWAQTGTTCLAVTSFLNYGISPNDLNVSNGLNYVLSRHNIDGSFGDYVTYETSLALIALSAARKAGYDPSTPDVDQYITDAMNWLLLNQNIETNTAITPSSPYYGGWNYNGAYSGWSDLSNTQFAMIGLSIAETYLKVPSHLKNWQAAAIFVARCNNNATNNPQFYLKDDGGFIYQPQSTIRTSTGDSYGSMTAAGVWALSLARMAGVTQIDMQWGTIDSIAAIYSGLEWLQNHYSITQNPVNYGWGGNSFTYYYFWSVAKAWEITNQTTVAGHDWYVELTTNLANTQFANGRWFGTGDEEPDVLATEWALLSLELPVVPQAVLQSSNLVVTLHSGADLHVYDQQGRHVGYNYSTQQDEIQIPNATYSGHGTEPQVITIPLTQGLKYRIDVVGTTGGSYDLVFDATTNGVVVAESDFNGTTSPGAVLQYNVEVVTIAGLSLLVQPPLAIQYQITFDQTGVGSDFTGTVITIDGTNYAANNLPASFLWNNGTTHAFSFQSPLVVSSGAKEYDWNSTDGLSMLQSDSISVTASGNVTGNYVARVHNVAVTNITADRTWVYYNHGFSTDINVTVLNNGDFDENITVTLYYNITANKIIGTQNLTLPMGQNDTVTFTWDTSGVPCPYNYTITANATIHADINITDNTLADRTIEVRIPGDITGDGSVNVLDAIRLGTYFGLLEGDRGWNPDADLNHDGKINIIDMIILASNFGNPGSP